MSARPLVSVGIPVYNEAHNVGDCIESVLAQTYPNVEICISDNASTDGTFDILQRLASNRASIRVERQEQNVGVLHNFEVVRRMARGKYFMWLGADDRILPTYVEKMVEQLEQHPSAAAAHSASLRVDDEGRTLSEVRYDGSFNPNNIGPLHQAMRVLTPFKRYRVRKLNLYVYGLYRRAVLDRIMTLPEHPLNAGDRVLPALAALSGGLRYVDEVLWIKHVYRHTSKHRQPEDPLHAARRRNTSLGNLVHWVLICPTIPWWRRLHGVIIAAPFLNNRALVALKRTGLPIPVRNKIEF
jgi:glycosyltransferase involved in cell wall biosynthesis